MNNTYLFIIWNKAMFKRKDILNDLSKSFNIKANILMKWNKENFDENLLAFYGHKMYNTEEKKHFIGTGTFNVVLVEDNNPVFDYRELQTGKTLVNTNIYDKKELYRNWTARCFRIHNSINEEETNHDLVVLFGNDIDKYIDNKEVLTLDTKGVRKFESLEDLLDCLKLFGNNETIVNENTITINCDNKYDIERFIKCKKDNDNYSLTINNIKYKVIINDNNKGSLVMSPNNSIFETIKSDIKYLIARIIN